MRTVGRIFLVFFLLVVFHLNGSTQEIHFSQFGSNPILFNPGSAGMANAFERAVLNFRSQWGFNGAPYQTLAFSFDRAFFEKQGRAAHLGAGLSAFRDQAGDGKLGKTQVGLCFSGILKVNRNNKFAVGIGANFNQRTLNYDALKWGSQYNGKKYDPNLNSNETNLLGSRMFFDFGLGGVWDYSVRNLNIQGGLSYYRISPQTSSLYPSGDLGGAGVLNLNFNLRKDLEESKLSILPAAMASIHGPLLNLTFGTMLRFKLQENALYTGFTAESAISVGLFYRLDDAIVPRLQYEFKNLGFGLSYDINASSLAGPMRRGTDSFEIFLKFQTNKNMAFNSRGRNKKGRY